MSIQTLTHAEIEEVTGGFQAVAGGFPTYTTNSNGWTTTTVSRPFEFSYGNRDGLNGSYSSVNRRF
ncbi:MAG: hypothetical protein VXW65_05380 [Pseudomonadota bacterium]|nr:hypothetical protein [Pseudomonadota bacterium]